MAGKRLLDVAALFNASRGVAQKHVALRSRQLEVWSQTSSVAKAVKSQTERVTETAKAASFLASRLSESAPSWTTEASQATEEKPIPRRENTEAEGTRSVPKEGLEQDHIYERAESNTSSDPVPTEDLEVRQKKADRYPLPDGTIPPANSSVNVPKRDQDVTSERVPSPPKDPLKDGHSEEAALRPASSGTSTIPNPTDNTKSMSSDRAKKLQRQFEQQIPSQPADAEEGHSDNKLAQGHDEDSFYTRSKHASPVLSSLPRVKIPKKTENTQSNDEHLQYNGINSDSYSAASTCDSTIPAAQAVPEQEEVPEGVNTDLFYSPRVAKMLGGRTQNLSKGDLKMKAAEKMHPGHPTEISGMKPEPESSAPANSFSKEKAAIGPKDDDVNQLAKDIAESVSKSPDVSVQWRFACPSFDSTLITDSYENRSGQAWLLQLRRMKCVNQKYPLQE
jgi:aarF domain-containing kinase